MPEIQEPIRQLTAVLSAGQSRNPEKRELEQGIADCLANLPGVKVVCVPHLYDLARDGEVYRKLKEIDSDIVLFSWLYDRAAHWILDRNGIRGQQGEVYLKLDGDDEQDEELDKELDSSNQADDERVIASQPRPARMIYSIDLRTSTQVQDYVQEVARIQQLASDQSLAGGGPSMAESHSLPKFMPETLQRFVTPTNDSYVGAQSGAEMENANHKNTLFGASSVLTITEHATRRWYPVIDFSRCTNCMECIDFCLFGVYGVDTVDTILVEQPDNCRKGCPACSRVCPQNAIIFPQHKTPAIAGAPVDSSGLKIDLSKLFGAPESDEDPAAVAARERDEQLILAGRAPVESHSDLSDRLAQSAATKKKPDELDSLLDELDSLDL